MIEFHQKKYAHLMGKRQSLVVELANISKYGDISEDEVTHKLEMLATSYSSQVIWH